MATSNRVQPESREAWRAWLLAHHTETTGVWLVTFKKSSGKQVLDNDSAIEEALCFGWIDSKPAKLDAERTMLYFAPRKPGSGWSQLNKQRIEKMLAEGHMHAAGWAKIEAAKQDGSWERLNTVDALEIPADLAEAFQRFPPAGENFSAFPKSARRGILEWIVQAKRAETRSKRIEETARLAAQNIRANQWPRPQREN